MSGQAQIARAVSEKKGMANAKRTYPPTAYILQTMIIKIEEFKREIIGTIKVRRYKTIKTVQQIPTAALFTKIMTFSCNEPIEWLEQELLERVDTLKRIHHIDSFLVREKKLLQADVKWTPKHKTVYLTSKLMLGWNLADILTRKQQLQTIINPQYMKELIWQMMSFFIAGKGFANLIVTNENFFFQALSQDKFKPAINYLSFAGYRFLREKRDIDREQYLQIAIFLDEEALLSGNIDRFQFKARNFACLLLSLLCQRNPAHFIFEHLNLEEVINIEKALFLHKNVVQTRLADLLSFKSLYKRIQDLNLPGLKDFLKSAFMQPQSNQNWSHVQTNLTLTRTQLNENSVFAKLAQTLWEAQTTQMKCMLQKQGLNFCKSQVYLAMKLSVNLQSMLMSNNWQNLLAETQYSRLKKEMYSRLLKLFQKQMTPQNVQKLRDVSQIILQKTEKIDNKEVVFLPYQRQILELYPR